MIGVEKDLRLLLLQIRSNSKVRQEEHQSFTGFSGLDASQIEILNVFDTPVFGTDAVRGYDGLLVGGASEASVLEPERNPFLDSGMALLRRCVEDDIPVFASCFGFQLAARAFGRDVMRDEHEFEQGSIPIQLTSFPAIDPLFHDMPNLFLAVSVHRERVLTVPEGCVELALTDMCCHAFRVKDNPFWVCQFHHEVDRKTLIERLTIYRKTYTRDEAHLKEVLAGVKETPESNGLIRKFVRRILLGEPGHS